MPFSFEGWKKHNILKIAGEVAAGHKKHLLLNLKVQVRIFTVQQFRRAADTVIMQEKVKIERWGIEN
jgi:molybdopterin biosynthesis enzyme